MEGKRFVSTGGRGGRQGKYTTCCFFDNGSLWSKSIRLCIIMVAARQGRGYSSTSVAGLVLNATHWIGFFSCHSGEISNSNNLRECLLD